MSKEKQDIQPLSLPEIKSEKGQEKKMWRNIYQRVQKVRSVLQSLNLKKTGENKFTKYSYYELGDFLPSLNKLMDENGIMTRFILSEGIAFLDIINTEVPEDQIHFNIPVAGAEVKGATPIQNLGSQVTYLRRYLLMIAFEISESDTVNAKKPVEESEEEKQIDEVSIDKIDVTKTQQELTNLCKSLKAELGPKYHKSLVTHYTRRKKEIEIEIEEESAKLADEVDKGLEEQKNG